VEQLAKRLPANEYRMNERFELFWQLMPLVKHYADVSEALNLLVGFLSGLREQLSERMREQLVDELQELGHHQALEFAIGDGADLSKVTFLHMGHRTAVAQSGKPKKGDKGDGSKWKRA
jgi:hypothetical protein